MISNKFNKRIYDNQIESEMISFIPKSVSGTFEKLMALELLEDL